MDRKLYIERKKRGSFIVLRESASSSDQRSTINGLMINDQRLINLILRPDPNPSRSYIITGDKQRTERWDFPPEALREIVVNMIVHRDYMDANDSLIKIFDDRIEFFNPGRLMDGLSVEHLLSGNYVSAVRNKQVATLFKEAGIIEKYGSGIRRILEATRAHGNPDPLFEEIQNGFRVTIFKAIPKKPLKETNEGVSKGVIEGLSGGVESLYQLILQKPGIRLPEISKILNVPTKTLERWAKQLRKDNRIEFKGAPKTGGYFVCAKGKSELNENW